MITPTVSLKHGVDATAADPSDDPNDVTHNGVVAAYEAAPDHDEAMTMRTTMTPLTGSRPSLPAGDH